MLVFRDLSSLRTWRNELSLKSPNLRVGFIPTMGCLHEGHLSLVNHAKSLNYNVTIVSIFVNPTQFGPNEDFEKYPRTEDSDLEMLKSSGIVDVAFLPTVSDIYPSTSALERQISNSQKEQDQIGTFVTVQGYSHQLEGAIRPFHFRGVATVVTKLFNMTQPHGAVFGQKDIQQCIVLKRMTRDLAFNIKLHIAPIKRESDGLAMSSRNRYLNPQQRLNAVEFPKALLSILTEDKRSLKRVPCTAGEIKQEIRDQLQKAIDKSQIDSVDYISLSNPDTLNEYTDDVKFGSSSPKAILSATIRVGNTRLLDNILLNMDNEFY